MTTGLENEAVWWIEILRGFLVGLAGIILGMAFSVVVVYGEKVIRKPKAILPRHVTLIALSYCLLIVVTGGTQLEFLMDDVAPSWRIPPIVVAYLLGVWALRLVLLQVTLRNNGPRRRATD